MRETNLPLSLTAVAQLVGCPAWWLREQFNKGALPEPPRIGRGRVLDRSIVATVRNLWRQRQARRRKAKS